MFFSSNIIEGWKIQIKYEKCLGQKQAQLTTMHSIGLYDYGHTIKELFVCTTFGCKMWLIHTQESDLSSFLGYTKEISQRLIVYYCHF